MQLILNSALLFVVEISSIILWLEIGLSCNGGCPRVRRHHIIKYSTMMMKFLSTLRPTTQQTPPLPQIAKLCRRLQHRLRTQSNDHQLSSATTRTAIPTLPTANVASLLPRMVSICDEIPLFVINASRCFSKQCSKTSSSSSSWYKAKLCAVNVVCASLCSGKVVYRKCVYSCDAATWKVLCLWINSTWN